MSIPPGTSPIASGGPPHGGLGQESLPRPIKVAIGFLTVDALWVALLLAQIGHRLWRDLEDDVSLLFPLVAFFSWLAIASASILGLQRRTRTGFTAAAALTAASAFLVGGSLASRIAQLQAIPLDEPTLVLSGGFACFVTPLFMLLAGRRAYLTPPGGAGGD